MSKPKSTQQTAPTGDVDAATLAQLKLLQQSKERSNRALRKRRRAKSGQ